MLKRSKEFLQDQRGASAVEYGLIVGLIAVALVLVLGALGGEEGLGGLFQTVVDEVTGVGEGDGG